MATDVLKGRLSRTIDLVSNAIVSVACKLIVVDEHVRVFVGCGEKSMVGHPLFKQDFKILDFGPSVFQRSPITYHFHCLFVRRNRHVGYRLAL